MYTLNDDDIFTRKEISMNKNSPVNRTVTALDAVLYALLMFGANFVSYYVGILSVNIIGKLVGLDGPVYDVAKAVPIIVLDMGVAFAVVLLADFLFFRGKMEKWTKVSFSSDALRVNFGVLVLPAEVLRFLLCMLFSGPGAIFGYRFFDGIFTFIPSFLHDQFYLTPHNRLESIRESGFSFGDNLTFFLYYLGYFLFTCVVLYFLFQYLWKQQERQQAHYEQNKLHMNSEQTKGASLHRLVNEQNFYYEDQLNWEDRLKFGAVSIGVHFAAYFVSSFLFSLLLGMLPPIAQYPLLGILYTVLPLFWMGKYLSSAIPPMYSLTDDDALWRKKAVSLMLPGEIVRFVLGILPSPLLRYGTVTSPLTGLLYDLLYITPTGKYESIMVNGTLGVLDIAVFLLIYFAYFAVYEFVVLRMFRKRLTRHISELEGELKEREKVQRG